MLELRDYQIGAVDQVDKHWEAELLRILLCAPTGSGKTVIAAHLIKRVSDAGGRAHFICDRESLIRQTSQRLAEWGLEHGVAQGMNTFGRTRRIQVLSAQTIAARDMELDADLTIVDEAHIIHKAVTKQLVESGKQAVALTATPFREGLGAIWQVVVNVQTTQKLVNEGWLARVKIYCGKPVQVGGKNSSGEYDTAYTSDSTLKIVGDIRGEWEEKTKLHFQGPVKTIAFANRVADAEKLALEFREAGHEFRAVSYLDAPEERRSKIEAHRRGDILGLVSVEALQRGYDVADILCGIGAHPWRKALTPVAQEIGRTMRIFEGKKYALWLDHAQNVLRFRKRLFEFWRSGCWQLDEGRDKEAGEDEPDRASAVCPKCNALLVAGFCRECGWHAKKRISAGGEQLGMRHVKGKLEALPDWDTRAWVAVVGRTEYELPAPLAGWLMICALAKKKGMDAESGQRWCQAGYRDLYGEFRMARYQPTHNYPVTVDPNLLAAREHAVQLWLNRKKRDDKQKRREAFSG